MLDALGVGLLVTGGMGFIGSNFIRYIAARYPNEPLINYDKLTYAGNPANLEGFDHPKYIFVRGDICDPKAASAAARGNVDTVVNFAAESVASDTPIPVHEGNAIRVRSIEHLFERHARISGVVSDAGGTEIVTVRRPLCALSFKNGMGNWCPVTHITRHWWKGKLLTLSQKWGEIRVTPNHSVYDSRGKLVQAATNPELLAIRKINVDRSRHRDHAVLRLPLGSSRGSQNHVFFKQRLAAPKQSWVLRRYNGDSLKALLRFLGAYVSEGNATLNVANGAWLTAISNTDLGFLRAIQNDVAGFSNASGVLTTRSRPQAHHLVFSSRILYLLATSLGGQKSGAKQIPDFLFMLRDEYKREFLETYLLGDGDVQHYKTVDSRRFTTVSPQLAARLGLLLSLMGLDYTISYRDAVPSRNWNRAYTIRITDHYDAPSRSQITEGEWEGYVYDLSVANSQNFAAGIGCLVVHNTHVDRSIADATSFIDTNVRGTHVLLEVARQQDLGFVQISSDEVYGSIEKGAFAEEDALHPSSPYSASKAAADLLCLSYNRTYGLKVKITRSTNNFGPYQFPEKLIPLLIINALRSSPLPIYGDGLNVRDWIYVEDACDAIDIVRARGAVGEVYNIGAKNERTNLEVARAILRILEKPEDLIHFVQDRPGHDRRYSVDTNRIQALGWKPRHPFRDALRSTVEWYREHEDRWRPKELG